jgi:hypothetical protein
MYGGYGPVVRVNGASVSILVKARKLYSEVGLTKTFKGIGGELCCKAEGVMEGCGE